MSTYGKVNEQGYLEYTVSCAIPQDHLILLNDIPLAPKPGLFFHVGRNQWEDLLSLHEKENLQKNAVRDLRNKLLQECDWTDTASAVNRLGQELYSNWQIYRQSLRDITTQSGYPFNVVWPTPPA